MMGHHDSTIVNSRFEQAKLSLIAQPHKVKDELLPVSRTLKNLMLNPTYIFSVLAVTNIMFILIACQY